ncbi:MAG: hypothetical protein UT11_C0034G0005 [Berkelbacteria bacterium GW2011_GWA2_38_9]|uniref:DUF5615 domain-containing protein n=1 Tax=Berkelbacteria bacterium GW2011_GWA2_38_9 TaxID=1618334 RepID=A0A0G0NR08_9BACT|nr:MAG: hypothetical protein UT11_C0034G0005 [Berkelbacteria bacterium GW2011_GWA2_38_9]
MKLLLDQNISRKLTPDLQRLFPGSSHVFILNLHQASDLEIWNYARDNDFIIVTQDSDFFEKSLIFGFPPKVIWLRSANTSTKNIRLLLVKFYREIIEFEKDETLGCLQIY